VRVTTTKESEGSYRVRFDGRPSSYTCQRNENEAEPEGNPDLLWVVRRDGVVEAAVRRALAPSVRVALGAATSERPVTEDEAWSLPHRPRVRSGYCCKVAPCSS